MTAAIAERLGQAGLALPLRVGHDGELLDAKGECWIVVDPNRELHDDHVRTIADAIVEAVTLSTTPSLPNAGEAGRVDALEKALRGLRAAFQEVANNEGNTALGRFCIAAIGKSRVGPPPQAGEGVAAAPVTASPMPDRMEQAREIAAQVFDARARKPAHPATITMERHHAKVIRAGKGDDYDVVQGVLLALAHPPSADQVGEGVAIPEGWKLVPVEPTDVMTTAGNRDLGFRYEPQAMRSLWGAMLAAAPVPPTPIANTAGVLREALRQEIINTPETADFMAGVPLEAAHQRDRWPSEHDAGKSPFDWFWLVGYLAQKAADAAVRADLTKAQHHTISTAAALANWHASLSGADTSMRPGIEPPTALSDTGAAGEEGR